MEWNDLYKACVGYTYELEKQMPRDKYIFYISGSYGDILPNLALLSSFYEKNKTPIIVLIKKQWKLLADRFNYPFVDYLIIEDQTEVRLRLSICNIGRPLLREPGLVFPLLPTLHPLMAEFCRSERVTDYEMRRGLLGLKVGTKFNVPSLTTQRAVEINRILSNLGVHAGRTICLSFLTNANDTPPDWVQALIYETFRDSGFDCILNVSETFPGAQPSKTFLPAAAKTVEIPCDCPFEFIEYFGGFVGALNGLTLMLAGVRKVSSHLAYTDIQSEAALLSDEVNNSTNEPRINRVLRHDVLNEFTVVPTELGQVAIVDACRDLMSRFQGQP